MDKPTYTCVLEYRETDEDEWQVILYRYNQTKDTVPNVLKQLKYNVRFMDQDHQYRTRHYEA